MFTLPKLVVQLERSYVYLFPSSNSSLPAPDSFVRGCLSLSLPRRRSGLSRLSVSLFDNTIYKPGGALGMGRQGETREWSLMEEVEIELDPRLTFEKGAHHWQFSFRLPATSTPYHHSEYGTTSHWVVARLESGKESEHGHEQVFKSSNTLLYLIPSSIREGESLDETNELVSTETSPLGLVDFNFSSSFLQVASLVLFSVSLPSVLGDVTVVSIAGFVTETFSLAYTTKSGPISLSPEPKKLPLFHLQQPQGLAKLRKGDEWQIQHLARLPHDGKLSCSTLEGSKTGLRVRHQIGVEVKYCLDGAKTDLVLRMGKKVTIASCHCPRDSYLPPPYVAQSPPAPAPPAAKESCLCSISLENLIAEQRQNSLQLTPQSRKSSGDPSLAEKTPAMAHWGFVWL